jgi:hypothetical protein
MAGGRAVMLAVLALPACDTTHDNHGIRSPDAAPNSFTFEVEIGVPEGTIVTADGETVTENEVGILVATWAYDTYEDGVAAGSHLVTATPPGGAATSLNVAPHYCAFAVAVQRESQQLWLDTVLHDTGCYYCDHDGGTTAVCP